MADVITIDVNEKPAIDGFENLIDEIIKTDKATDKLEASGAKAVNTINRIRPAAAQTGQQVSALTSKLAQLGGEVTTGSGKFASFVPDLLKLGPGATVALAGVAGLAGGLAVLNNTGLREGKSNLDRLGGAFGDLYKSVGPTVDIIKTADDTITGISDTIVFNTQKLTENANAWVNWIKGIENTPGADKFFERTEKGFNVLQEEEKRLAAESMKRGQASELASVKTIEGINQRVKWLKEEQAQIILGARNEKERDQLIQESFEKRKALEARALEIEREIAAQRAINAKYWADLRIASEKRVADDYKRSQDFQSKAYAESIEFQKRIAKDWGDFQKGLASDRREGFLDTAEAIIRAKAEEEKANAERLDGAAKEAAIKKSNDELDGSLHSLRLKRIREEAEQRLQATKIRESEEALRLHNATENDAKLNSQTIAAFKKRQAELQQNLANERAEGAKIILDSERKTAEAEADFKRQQLVKQINDRTEAARKTIQIEKDKKSAIDNIAKDLGGSFDAGAVLKAQDPRQVRANLIDRARSDAAAGGGDKRDQAAAARQAAIDFQKGTTDPNKMAQAAAQAANKTVGAMVASGKLDGDFAKGFANQIQIAAKAQAEAEKLRRDMEEVQKVQEALLNAANPQRSRAGRGGQRG
jgi:hypothetical protein